jgi:hypothetical protein
MRKAILSVLVAVSLWGATSWQPAQPLPQWRLVAEQHRISGTNQFNDVPIFTPQANKFYRLSATCTASGIEGDNWSFFFLWAGGYVTVDCAANQFLPSQQIVVAFVPKAAEPMLLTATQSPADSSTYDAVYTIEELE